MKKSRTKESKLYKKQETEILKNNISQNNLLVSDVAIEKYVSEGAGQKVYLKDGKSVIKLNDAIFYTRQKMSTLSSTVIIFANQILNLF